MAVGRRNLRDILVKPAATRSGGSDGRCHTMGCVDWAVSCKDRASSLEVLIGKALWSFRLTGKLGSCGACQLQATQLVLLL